MDFEWNPKKAAENIRDHGVTFTEAKQAFADFYAVEVLDDAHSTAEDTCFQMIALAGNRILFVVYTMRGENYRIITAREVENHEREYYEQERSADAFYQ